MRLYRNERRHFIGVFFRPPSSGIDVLIEFEKSLALLNRNGIKHKNAVITGDFNLLHFKCNDGSPAPSDNSE